MNEIWKPIEGFEGYYEVSNLGQVRSCDRYVNNGLRGKKRFVSGNVLKPTVKSCNGYRDIQLRINGVVTRRSVTLLVATAFLDNPTGASRVRHIDGDVANNCVDNLEWITKQVRSNMAKGIRDSEGRGRNKYSPTKSKRKYKSKFDPDQLLDHYKKEKFKILKELGVRMTDEDKKRIEDCTSELQVDNVARRLILR